jgi:hypothetical protein
MFKKALILFTVIGAFHNANAQFSMGVDVNYKLFFDGGDLSAPSLGIHYSKYMGDGDVMFYGGFGFGFPKTVKGTVAAVANDFSNPVPVINVEYTQRFTNFYFDFGGGKIFNGDYEDGGFMVYGGLSALISRYKGTLGSYNTSDYYINSTSTLENTNMYMAYGIKLGLGYLLRFGTLGLTPYAEVTIPVINLDEDFKFPTYLGIGARFCFFAE